jgi:hypothetical protein
MGSLGGESDGERWWKSKEKRSRLRSMPTLGAIKLRRRWAPEAFVVRAKYRCLSTARRTIELSAASVEMTFVLRRDDVSSMDYSAFLRFVCDDSTGTGLGRGLVLLSIKRCRASSTLTRAKAASRQPRTSTRLPSRSL